jgi:hypothetical protein
MIAADRDVDQSLEELPITVAIIVPRFLPKVVRQIEVALPECGKTFGEKYLIVRGHGERERVAAQIRRLGARHLLFDFALAFLA